MEFSEAASVLVRALWSAGVVIFLSAVAERVSPRVSGVLAGAPLTAVFVYMFVGLDMGIEYAVESVPHGIAAFTATVAFVLAYHRATLWFSGTSAIPASVLGLAMYFVVASMLATIPLALPEAIGLTLASLALATWLFRNITFVRIEKPVRYTLRLMALRGALAACLVVGVVVLARSLGTRWAGLLAGFPATLLPTLLIIHLTYGRASVHAVIRNFPLGMGSIIIYILSVRFTFSTFGVYGGTLASLVLSLVYLMVVLSWAREPLEEHSARAQHRDRSF